MKRIILTLVMAALLVTGFASGAEQIRFNLKFGFIKGGEAELIIKDTLYYSTRAKHYRLVGKTTGLTDKLFGVNDIYETTVDAKTRLPLKSIRNVNEGKYRWYNETLYYHDNDSVYSQKSGGRLVPHNLLDIVSVFFYFIHHHLLDDLKPGSSMVFPTFHADKISDVKVQYVGDQRIETDLGKIDCYVLIPAVDKGRVLKRSDGLKVFISKESKLPVMLEFDMRVGALRAELESYTINGKRQKAR